MSSVSWKLSAVVAAACVFMIGGTASAQICGDGDNSGTVTVTDGVQALRAAAALTSSCSAATCDVDGSGTVTVSDGVNILRKAAGVAITENCPGTSLDTQVEDLLESTLPVFGNLTKFAAPSAAAAGTEQFACDNQGSVTFDPDTGEFFFDDCDLEGFNYDGSLQIGDNTLAFDLNSTDLTTGQSETLVGSLSQRAVGETFVFDGFFQLFSDFGAFSVGFDNLVPDPVTGLFVGGALDLSIDDGQLEEVESIRLAFDPSNIAVVDVNLVDGSTVPFNFNLVTGELTRISN